MHTIIFIAAILTTAFATFAAVSLRFDRQLRRRREIAREGCRLANRAGFHAIHANLRNETRLIVWENGRLIEVFMAIRRLELDGEISRDEAAHLRELAAHDTPPTQGNPADDEND